MVGQASSALAQPFELNAELEQVELPFLWVRESSSSTLRHTACSLLVGYDSEYHEYKQMKSTGMPSLSIMFWF